VRSRLTPELRAAIERAAIEDGVDPATALAYAERESSFNPMARNSKTIRGLYQMRGDLRQQYGVGDSDDPYVQTKGFNRLLADNRKAMSQRLGRDVDDAEAYAGHHFGAGRAASMFRMDPNTDVAEVFTPYERSINPHITRAGTVGGLLGEVTGDINKRRSTYGAGASDLDFSAMGEPVGDQPTMMASAKPEALDFSQFGEAAA
jgi:transglycosylase-like protein with SLT domain